MKISDGLTLKAEYCKQRQKLALEALSNAVSTEGIPVVDPEAKIHEIDKLNKKLLEISVAINKSNEKILVNYRSFYSALENSYLNKASYQDIVFNKVKPTSKPMIEALLEQERLLENIRSYQAICDQMAIEKRIYEEDVQTVHELSLEAVKRKKNCMSKFLRVLSNEIEEVNHKSELEFEV